MCFSYFFPLTLWLKASSALVEKLNAKTLHFGRFRLRTHQKSNNLVSNESSDEVQHIAHLQLCVGVCVAQWWVLLF